MFDADGAVGQTVNPWPPIKRTQLNMFDADAPSMDALHVSPCGAVLYFVSGTYNDKPDWLRRVLNIRRLLCGHNNACPIYRLTRSLAVSALG